MPGSRFSYFPSSTGMQIWWLLNLSAVLEIVHKVKVWVQSHLKAFFPRPGDVHRSTQSSQLLSHHVAGAAVWGQFRWGHLFPYCPFLCHHCRARKPIISCKLCCCSILRAPTKPFFSWRPQTTSQRWNGISADSGPPTCFPVIIVPIGGHLSMKVKKTRWKGKKHSCLRLVKDSLQVEGRDQSLR